MTDQPTAISKDDNRRNNMLIGAVTLIVLFGIFFLGLALQKSRAQREEIIVMKADSLMAMAIAGQCDAFGQARDLYMKATKFHLQSKELVGKAQLADELANLCGEKARAALAEFPENTLPENPDQAKTMALIFLAAGNRQMALDTINRFPNDAFCRWLWQWLAFLPPTKQP